MSRRRLASVVLVTVLASFACGPLSSLTDSQADSQTCSGIKLAAGDALPGDQVEVDGLAEVDDLSVFSVTWDPADGGDSFDGLVYENGDGLIMTVVPPHPDGIAGGDLVFNLLEDDAACAEQPLTVGALEPAPGAYQEVVDLTGEFVEIRRQALGVTREELVSGDLTNASSEVVVLAMMQVMYDGPDNPDSLVKVADGSAAMLQEQALNRETLDAVTAHYDISQWMRDRLEEERQARRPGPVPSYGRPARQSITTPAQLADAMIEQAECEIRLTGPAGDIRMDYEAATIGLGLINGPAGLAAGGAMFLWRLYDEHCAYTLPGEFSRIMVQLTPTSFEEDYDQADGEVLDVTVYAKSAGWELSGAVLDGVLLLSGLGMLGKSGKLASTMEWVGAVNGALNQLCSRDDDCSNQEMLKIPSETFGPVRNLADPAWSTMEVRPAPQEAIVQTGDFTYRPVEVGTSKVEIYVNDDAFGYETISVEEVIEVMEISVQVDPSSVRLEPGQSQTFSVTIENALYPELNEWTLIAPGGSTQIVAVDSETWTFTAPDFSVTPTNECDPDEQKRVWGLSVESTSYTGPRANSTEPRIGQAGITVVKEPEENCPTPTPTPRPDQCLIGTWELDLDTYLEYMQTFNNEEASFSDVEGSLMVTFTENWEVTTTSDLDLTISSAEGSLNFDVEETGTTGYGVDNSTDTLIVEGGQFVTATVFETSDTAETEGGSSQYSCSGDTLIIDPGIEYPDLLFNRTN